jgi:DeoR family ulaG and ulaABCDEF operon transcriptional repressor
VFREQKIVLSPFENDTTENFWGDKLFTGCYGINRFGLMEADPLIVQAQTKLLKRSQEVIVMADSSKLRQKSAMIVSALSRISTLITDSDARPDEVEALRSAGLRIFIAQITEEDQQQSA